MSSNVCGNCANFKPKQGENFFNCTFAKQAGVSYGMQVRADTRSCEAFTPIPIKPPPKPQAAVKPAVSTTKRVAPPRGGLCKWGRLILVATILIIIVLIAFGAYSCFSGASPEGTPTPTPGSGTLTPTPVPSYQVGSWTQFSDRLIYLSSPTIGQQYKYTDTVKIAAPAGTSFLLVTVTEYNISSQAIPVQASDFYLEFSMGNDTLQFQHNSIPLLVPFAQVQSYLQPGQQVSGYIMFTVPDTAKNFKICTVLDGDIVSWKLGF